MYFRNKDDKFENDSTQMNNDEKRALDMEKDNHNENLEMDFLNNEEYVSDDDLKLGNDDISINFGTNDIDEPMTKNDSIDENVEDVEEKFSKVKETEDIFGTVENNDMAADDEKTESIDYETTEEILNNISEEKSETDATKTNDEVSIENEKANEQVEGDFFPEAYIVDVTFKEESFLTYSKNEMSEKELEEYMLFAKIKMKAMQESINGLISVVKRKQKKSSQFDDVKRLYDGMVRDFEQYKKRNKELEQTAKQKGYIKAIEKILPTLDNFDRAMAMIEDNAAREGVELIQRELLKELSAMGLKEIDCMGKEFDPNFHNAVTIGEAKAPEEVDTVIEVFQKGYMCGDKVIRYAQVRVAK